MSATTFNAEETAWAQQVAARLKFVQADFSDVGPPERHSYLAEEISRALGKLPTEKHKRHLAALAEQFPAGMVLPTQALPQVEMRENSPEEMVDALVRIAPQLPKRTLAEFGLRLQQAGYMELKSTMLMTDPPEEFLKFFKLEPGTPIDLPRLYRLTLALADCYFRLEMLSWNIWRQLAPQSRIRRESTSVGDALKLAPRYLTGDSEVSADQIKAVVERTRALISSVLGSLGAAGRSFARRFFADFSPDEVLKVARSDNSLSGLLVTEEQKCWRKYKQLVKLQSDEVIEEKLRESIASETEELMRGLGRRESQ